MVLIIKCHCEGFLVFGCAVIFLWLSEGILVVDLSQVVVRCSVLTLGLTYHNELNSDSPIGGLGRQDTWAALWKL